MKKVKDFGKAGVLVSCLGVGFIAAMLVLTSPSEVLVEDVYQRSWKAVPMGDADPGAGASGVLIVYVVARSAFTYTSNISINASVFGSEETNNSHAGNNIPYDTYFDVVVKVRWNKTHAYSTSNSTWMLPWVRGNTTCALLSISADTAMDEYNISGTTNGKYIWVHYVIDNGGTGYSISRGDNITSHSFTFDAYY